MTKTQKQRVKKYIAALRSGKYRQAQGMLKDGRKYCCLGVACKVYENETGLGKFKKGVFIDIDSYLPTQVQEWFGFDNQDPLLKKGLIEVRAIDLNDNFKFSFKQIADCFENTFIKVKK